MDQITLEPGDAAIVIRADKSVEGWMPETDGDIIEKESVIFWASAVILMFGEGEDCEEMRNSLADWFEGVCS